MAVGVAGQQNDQSKWRGQIYQYNLMVRARFHLFVFVIHLKTHKRNLKDNAFRIMNLMKLSGKFFPDIDFVFADIAEPPRLR